MKFLQTTVALLCLLSLCNVHVTLAASGGIMGGSSIYSTQTSTPTGLATGPENAPKEQLLFFLLLVAITTFVILAIANIAQTSVRIGDLAIAQTSVLKLQLLNANKIQPVSQNLFELHALEPEPEFVDPDVVPALVNLKKRPKRIRKIAKRLSTHVGKEYAIRLVSPDGMYPEPFVEVIPYSELLQIFLNGWLDYSVLHWFAMHFFESPNSHCAFFNPKLINCSTCLSNRLGVGEHMHNICMLHSKKKFFIAPYVAGKHWSLLIFCPSFNCGYIIDSLRGEKNETYYLLVSIYEEVFKTRLTWHMVQCKQQQSTWECGYIVIKHMQEFVQDIQHDLFNRLWREEGLFSDLEIEDLVVRSMKEFINKVFGARRLNRFSYRANHEFYVSLLSFYRGSTPQKKDDSLTEQAMIID